MFIEILNGVNVFSRLRIDYRNEVVDIESQPNRNIKNISDIFTYPNTHISIGLTGWPAAATVVGLGAIAGLTIVSVVYIKTNHKPKATAYGSYEV